MQGARQMAAVSGLMNVTLAALYAGPDGLVRRPLEPGQVSAVVYIGGFGPLWVVGFLLTGIALLVAYVRKKGFVRAHIAAAVLIAFYSGCVLTSAILTEPPIPVLLGTVMGFVSILHIVIARSDAERGCR